MGDYKTTFTWADCPFCGRNTSMVGNGYFFAKHGPRPNRCPGSGLTKEQAERQVAAAKATAEAP